MDRAWKIGIATGVISTALFLYCLDPILRGVGLILFHVSGTVFQAYRDRLFAQAALGVPPDPALFLFVLVLSVVAGFFTTAVVLLVILGHARPRPRELEAATPAGRRRFWRTMLVIGVLFFDAFTVLLLYNVYFQMQITTSFRQHTTAIAPYVSDQDMKLLLSRWTQMRTEADYQVIYRDLKGIADKNHIVLPDNSSAKCFAAAAFAFASSLAAGVFA
jgi:hypothetical protein